MRNFAQNISRRSGSKTLAWPVKSSRVPQEANVPGAGWVKFVLLTHNELSDLAKFYKDDQREFELQALLNVAQDILEAS